MDLGRLRFFLGEVLRNFTRNAPMQATAIGTVAVTIVLLGSFLYVRDTLTSFGTGVLRQIEIAVYLNDNVDDAGAKSVAGRLAADRRIASARYVPRTEGLRQMRERLGSDFDTSLLTANPLPNKFTVRVKDPELVPAVAASIKKFPGVAKVDFAADAVRTLLRVAAVLQRIGIAMIAVLVLTASVIIANTIRLTVFSRRREIAIMQLVGATGMYIRMPFLAEGMLAGLLGSALAVGLLALAKVQIIPKLAAALAFVPFHADERTIVLELLAVGAAVGLVSSWVSVGRYLRT